METRNVNMDALKMVLMITVIFGHIPLIGGLVNIGAPQNFDFPTMHAVKAIYAFHMPLFVFLSGYFTRPKNPLKQWQDSVYLLKLFAVFQLIDIGLRYIFTPDTISWRTCFSPAFALWYLICLFYWRILISYIPRDCNSILVVGITFLLSLGSGFIPLNNELGFQRFFSFMPFFTCGYYWGGEILRRCKEIIGNMHTGGEKLCLSIAMMLTILASFNPYWLEGMVFNYANPKMMFIRMVYMIGSMILCGFIIILFSCRTNRFHNWLAQKGKGTLFFYLLHPYVLYVTIQIWMALWHENTIYFWDAVIIAAAVVMILNLLYKLKIKIWEE